MVDTLAMTGVDILKTGPWRGPVTLAQLVVEAADVASLAVEERTNEIEAELLLIHRDGRQLKDLLAKMRGLDRNSLEYKELRERYSRITKDLVREMNSLPSSSTWSFLRRATTSEPRIVMKELRAVTTGFVTRLLGERLARIFGVREAVRWDLNERFNVSRSLTRAQWKGFDRFARRVGDIVEGIALTPIEVVLKTVITSSAEGWAAAVTQYRYGDCYDAFVTWLSPPSARIEPPHPVPSLAREVIPQLVAQDILKVQPSVQVAKAPGSSDPPPPPPGDGNGPPSHRYDTPRDFYPEPPPEPPQPTTSTPHEVRHNLPSSCRDTGLACRQLIQIDISGVWNQ